MKLEIPLGLAVEEPAFECPTCSDRGWRRMKSENRVTRCECQLPRNNQRQVRRTMALAGLEADEIESAFTPWNTDHQDRPEFAREWLQGAMVGELGEARNPWVLTLLGRPGRGKSKTAAVCVRIFIEAGGKSPLWVRVPEGFDQVQAERRSDAYLEETALEKRIERAGLAVFDDFGIAHRSNPELLEETVNEWLARRHRRRGLSIITSNALAIDKIGAPRIESRVAEGVYRLMEADSDYRDSR